MVSMIIYFALYVLIQIQDLFILMVGASDFGNKCCSLAISILSDSTPVHSKIFGTFHFIQIGKHTLLST